MATINSERLDQILDEVERELPGENRGDLIFLGDNGAEFDFAITDTLEEVEVYHDTILIETIDYADEEQFVEDLLDTILPYLDA